MTGKEALKTIILGTNVDTYRSSVDEIDNAISIIEKELKALEIIKDKGNFISPEYDENRNKYYIYDNESYEHNEITREEYELLKEVL